MAKYNQGPTGAFSGKIGPVVGSSWKGIPYMKARPKRSAKATQGELANRAKFKIAQRWLAPLLEFVRVGWKGYTPTVEGFIAAKSYLMKNAMEGTGVETKIIPSKMLVSYGDLPLSENISVQVIEGNILQFSWDTATPDKASLSDQAMLLAYDPAHGYNSVFDKPTGQFRYIGSDILRVDSGRTYQVYMAFLADDRSRQSMSVYLGEITV
jgi:hypothetical protein